MTYESAEKIKNAMKHLNELLDEMRSLKKEIKIAKYFIKQELNNFEGTVQEAIELNLVSINSIIKY